MLVAQQGKIKIAESPQDVTVMVLVEPAAAVINYTYLIGLKHAFAGRANALRRGGNQI